MDIVHHALIGGVGLVTAQGYGLDLAGLGFLAGSVLPDLDVLLVVAGRRFYLRNHQGLSHSLVVAPLAALLAFLLPGLRSGEAILLWGGILAGSWTHSLLDLFNTFRVSLLAPLSPGRFSLDAVFFIDVPAIALTLAFYAVHRVDRRPVWGLVYGSLLVIYLFVRLAIHRAVTRGLRASAVIPSALCPFEFYVLERDTGAVRTFVHDALRGRSRDHESFPSAPERVVELARRSALFRDMEEVCRALHITRADERPDGVTIEARDLAVRNFGGRFGRTKLEFDGALRLVSEHADI